MTKIKIFLSGGHGANTPGKRSPDGKLREYDFNNATTQFFKKIMEQYQDVEVIHVNDLNGKDTPLRDRTKIANDFYIKNDKDIRAGKVKVYYMSFHANAMSDKWSTAEGSETLVYKKGSEAYKFAQIIEQETGKLTGLKSRGVKIRTDLHEMRETLMPAMLHEAAFMDNRAEYALLLSDSFRQKVAQGVANAFEKHLGLKKKASSSKPPQEKPNTGGTSGETEKGLYHVQVGAFVSPRNAEALKEELQKAGFSAFIKQGG